ncbi:MAG: hypothetical protein HY534_04140 [Chloroflexi bacterium]|nr:hypothetical protein [Chloroflexota bacterium]
MIFADFYGPPSLFASTMVPLQEGIARVFKARAEDIVLRRVEVDSDYPATEIWIELSSDEQLVRHGKELAQTVTRIVQGAIPGDVWVLFRVVPLRYVYLNGEPRARGMATLE